MLEQVVASLLQRLLSDYVKRHCFESSKIQTDMWRGHLSLEALELKSDILERLVPSTMKSSSSSTSTSASGDDALPFKMLCGLIDGLELHWKSSLIFGGDEPIRLEVRRVFLLVGPRTKRDKAFARRSNQKTDLEMKRDRLAKFEKLISASADEAGPAPDSAAAESGFWDRLGTKLLDDLVVSVRQVHIRYEDNCVSDPRCSFSCGIKLESIVMTNGDATTSDEPSSDASPTVKRATLQQLSAYWDPHLRGSAFDFTDHHYVLQPLDATVQHRTTAKQRTIEVGVNSIEVSFQDRQFREALSLYAAVSERKMRCVYRERARAVRHVGPLKRPIRRGPNARRWWIFARAALMGPSYYRRTGRYLIWRRRTRLEYTDLWVRHRASLLGIAETYDDDRGDDGGSDGVFEKSHHGEPSSEGEHHRKVLRIDHTHAPRVGRPLVTLSSHEEMRLKHLDATLPTEDIVFFRCLAERELKWLQQVSSWSSAPAAATAEDTSERQSKTASNDVGSSGYDSNDASSDDEWWFQRVVGSFLYSSVASSTTAGTTRKEHLDLLYEEVSRAIDFDATKKRKSAPPLELLVRFTLKSGSVSLATQRAQLSTSRRPTPPFVEARLDRFTFDLLRRPDETFKLDARLADVSVFDRHASVRSLFRKILGQRRSDSTFIALRVDTAASSGVTSLRVGAIDVVYLPRCLALLRRFVESIRGHLVRGGPRRASSSASSRQMIALWKEVESAALDKLADLRTRTHRKLREVLGVGHTYAGEKEEEEEEEEEETKKRKKRVDNGTSLFSKQQQLRRRQRLRGGHRVDVHIEAPRVVVPENPCDRDAAVLVVDLGALTMQKRSTSTVDDDNDAATTQATPSGITSLITGEVLRNLRRRPTTTTTTTAEAKTKSRRDTMPTTRAMALLDRRLYDCQTVCISSVRVMLGSWEKVLGSDAGNDRSRTYLVRPVDITLTIKTLRSAHAAAAGFQLCRSKLECRCDAVFARCDSLQFRQIIALGRSLVRRSKSSVVVVAADAHRRRRRRSSDIIDVDSSDDVEWVVVESGAATKSRERASSSVNALEDHLRDDAIADMVKSISSRELSSSTLSSPMPSSRSYSYTGSNTELELSDFESVVSRTATEDDTAYEEEEEEEEGGEDSDDDDGGTSSQAHTRRRLRYLSSASSVASSPSRRRKRRGRRRRGRRRHRMGGASATKITTPSPGPQQALRRLLQTSLCVRSIHVTLAVCASDAASIPSLARRAKFGKTVSRSSEVSEQHGRGRNEVGDHRRRGEEEVTDKVKDGSVPLVRLEIANVSFDSMTRPHDTEATFRVADLCIVDHIEQCTTLRRTKPADGNEGLVEVRLGSYEGDLSPAFKTANRVATLAIASDLTLDVRQSTVVMLLAAFSDPDISRGATSKDRSVRGNFSLDAQSPSSKCSAAAVSTTQEMSAEIRTVILVVRDAQQPRRRVAEVRLCPSNVRMTVDAEGELNVRGSIGALIVKDTRHRAEEEEIVLGPRDPSERHSATFVYVAARDVKTPARLSLDVAAMRYVLRASFANTLAHHFARGPIARYVAADAVILQRRLRQQRRQSPRLRSRKSPSVPNESRQLRERRRSILWSVTGKSSLVVLPCVDSVRSLRGARRRRRRIERRSKRDFDVDADDAVPIPEVGGEKKMEVEVEEEDDDDANENEHCVLLETGDIACVQRIESDEHDAMEEEDEEDDDVIILSEIVVSSCGVRTSYDAGIVEGARWTVVETYYVSRQHRSRQLEVPRLDIRLGARDYRLLVRVWVQNLKRLGARDPDDSDSSVSSSSSSAISSAIASSATSPRRAVSSPTNARRTKPDDVVVGTGIVVPTSPHLEAAGRALLPVASDTSHGDVDMLSPLPSPEIRPPPDCASSRPVADPSRSARMTTTSSATLGALSVLLVRRDRDEASSKIACADFERFAARASYDAAGMLRKACATLDAARLQDLRFERRSVFPELVFPRDADRNARLPMLFVRFSRSDVAAELQRAASSRTSPHTRDRRLYHRRRRRQRRRRRERRPQHGAMEDIDPYLIELEREMMDDGFARRPSPVALVTPDVVNLCVQAPRCVVVPDALAEIARFFEPPRLFARRSTEHDGVVVDSSADLTSSAASLADAMPPSSSSDKSPSSSTSRRASPPSPRSPRRRSSKRGEPISRTKAIEILLDVSEPELWLVEDPAQVSSPAIVLIGEALRARYYSWQTIVDGQGRSADMMKVEKMNDSDDEDNDDDDGDEDARVPPRSRRSFAASLAGRMMAAIEEEATSERRERATRRRVRDEERIRNLRAAESAVMTAEMVSAGVRTIATTAEAISSSHPQASSSSRRRPTRTSIDAYKCQVQVRSAARLVLDSVGGSFGGAKSARSKINDRPLALVEPFHLSVHFRDDDAITIRAGRPPRNETESGSKSNVIEAPADISSIRSSLTVRELRTAVSIARSLAPLGEISRAFKASDAPAADVDSSSASSSKKSLDVDVLVDSVSIILIHDDRLQKLPIASLQFGDRVRLLETRHAKKKRERSRRTPNDVAVHDDRVDDVDDDDDDANDDVDDAADSSNANDEDRKKRSGSPVVRERRLPVVARFAVGSRALSAQMRIPVTVFSYNSDLVEFEPAIEPWLFRLMLVVPKSDSSAAVRTVLSADRVLNLNVTEHLLANLTRLSPTTSAASVEWRESGVGTVVRKRRPTATSAASDEVGSATDLVVASSDAAGASSSKQAPRSGSPTSATPTSATYVTQRKTYSLYEIHNELPADANSGGPKCRVRHAGTFKGVWSAGDHRPLQLSRSSASETSPFVTSSGLVDLEIYYDESGVMLGSIRNVNIDQLGAQYHTVRSVSLLRREERTEEEDVGDAAAVVSSKTATPVIRGDGNKRQQPAPFGAVVTEVVSNINGGFKLLRICSTAALHNRSNIRLEVSLVPLSDAVAHLPPRFRKAHRVVLEGGASASVPIHLGQLALTLRVRPLSSSASNGDDDTDDGNTLEAVEIALPPGSGGGDDDDETLTQTCRFVSRFDDDRALSCVVHVHSERCTRRGTPRHVRAISFHPPLLLQNCLPSPVEYRFQEAAASEEEEEEEEEVRDVDAKNADASRDILGILPSGNVVARHDLAQRSPRLSIRTEGYTWSSSTSLRARRRRIDSIDNDDGEDPTPRRRRRRKKRPLDSIDDEEEILRARVFLRDECGERLTVSVALTRLACGSVRCALFVPYWIVNRTFRPLLLRHGRRSGASSTDSNSNDIRAAPGQARTRRLMDELKAVSHKKRRSNVKSVGDGARSRQKPCSRLVSRMPGPCLGVLELLPPASKRIVRDPLLFDYDDSTDDVEDEEDTASFSLRAVDSDWSFPLVLNKVGVTRQISVKERLTGRTLLFGVSVQSGTQHFHRTRTVVIMPRFIVVNDLERAVRVKQSDATDRHALTLRPSGGQSGLHWVPSSSSSSSSSSSFFSSVGDGSDGSASAHTISIRLDEFGWIWSGSVELRCDAGSSSITALRLQNANTHRKRIVRVETFVDPHSPAVIVRIRDQAPSGPPYRIENLSLQRVRFAQIGSTVDEVLLPYHVRSYAWDEPTHTKMLRVDVDSESRPTLGTFSLDKIQTHGARNNAGGLRVVVSTDGPTRVLRITDGGDAYVRVDRENFYRGGASAEDDAQEERTMMRRTTRSIAVATPQLRLEFHANLRGFGVSVVDCTPQELVYATIVGVRIRVRSDAATKTTSAHLSVGRVQIDNQLFTTPYPVLMRAHRRGGGGEADDEERGTEFLEIDVRKDHRYNGLEFFDACTVRMEPVELNIDSSLFPPLLRMAAARGGGVDVAVVKQTTTSLRVDEDDEADEDAPDDDDYDEEDENGEDEDEHAREATEIYGAVAPTAKKYYFKSISVAPIRVCLSFVSALPNATSSSSSSSNESNESYKAIVLSAAVRTIANVENVVLSTRAIEMDHILATPETVRDKIFQQYRRDFFLQAHKIVGAADILGNPVESVRRVARGLADLFSNPNVARGLASLARHLLCAFTETVAKITFGATKGLEPLILYIDEYTAFRPRDGVFAGVASGVADFVSTPIRSVGERGLVRGLPGGAFAGVAGLFLKPFAGMLYSAGTTCAAIQHLIAPESLVRKRMLQRERPPRFFTGPHSALRPYRRDESEGEEFLSRVDNGRYRSDRYVTHERVEDEMIVLLTQQRLFLIHGGRERFCDKSWVVGVGEIVGTAQRRDRAIELMHFPGLLAEEEDDREMRCGRSGFTFVRRTVVCRTVEQRDALCGTLDAWTRARRE